MAAAAPAPAGFDSGLTQGKQFSITITNDAQRKSHCLHFRRSRYSAALAGFPSHLVLLQIGTALWLWNGRVSELRLWPPRQYPRVIASAINAPATGNTFDMFHTAALAIGQSEPAVSDVTRLFTPGNLSHLVSSKLIMAQSREA